MNSKKFIEVSFPVKEISEEIIKRKKFSDKGYSYLNIWENNILNVLSPLTQIPSVEVEE
jgi:hypothetical protein